MNPRTTGWLVFLALGLGAFIFFYERRTPDTEQALARAARLFPDFAPRDVTSVEIVTGANPMLALERHADRWRFRAPVPYAADAGGVEQLLSAVQGLQRRGTVPAQEVLAQTNGLAAFGLQPPRAIVVLHQAKQRTELHLGLHTIFGNQVYLEVVGRSGLVAIDAGFTNALPASENAWRDRQLVSLAGVEYNRIETRPGGFTIVRGPVWQMTKPLLTLANNAKLETLLQRLQLGRVAEFVTDDPRADLEPYGLQPPERELVLAQDTNEVVVLQMGKSPTNTPNQVYVRLLSHTNVVLVDRTVVAPWLGSYRDFYDHRLMVFRPEAVDRIEARAAEDFALQRGTNGLWRIVAPFAAPADTGLVAELLGNLAELEFTDFEKEVVTDFAPYGLAPPRRQYVLKALLTNNVPLPTNQIVAQVDFGLPHGATFFARRSLENSVVNAVDPGRLPPAAFEVRDRRIWDFSTNQIVSITIQQNGRTRTLLRRGPFRWEHAPGSQGVLNNFSLEEAAFRLGHLRAERWVARGQDQLARYGIPALDHQVTVELTPGSQPQSRTVRFGRLGPGGRPYAAVELGDQPGPVIFECPGSIWDFVLSDLTAPPPPGG